MERRAVDGVRLSIQAGGWWALPIGLGLAYATFWRGSYRIVREEATKWKR
jgi:hypothetical protein